MTIWRAILLGALLAVVGAQPAHAQVETTDNAGTVKIHDGADEPDPEPRNQPHVCTFHIHAVNFDPGQELTFTVKVWAPTGDGETVLTGAITADDSGEGRAPAEGAYALPDGHYKLFVDTGEGRPIRDKHKVFWVNCQASSTSSSSSSSSTSSSTSTTLGGSTTTTLGPGETTTTVGGGSTTTVGGAGSTTPSGGGTLPITGASAMLLLLAATTLLAGGSTAVMFAQRRARGQQG